MDTREKLIGVCQIQTRTTEVTESTEKLYRLLQLTRFDLALVGEEVRLTQTIISLKDNDLPPETRLIATSLVTSQN